MYIYIYFETKILFGIIFEIGMTRREIIKKKKHKLPVFYDNNATCLLRVR